MKHEWRSISADQKAEIIKGIWFKGISASQIAENFSNVTRNAVIGFYSRHADKLTDCPLQAPHRPPSRDGRKIRPERQKRAVRKAKVIAFKAGHEPSADIFTTVGVPLTQLGHRQCRFEVSDSPYGEEHLFCGAKTERGHWCEHHRALVYQPRSEVNMHGIAA